MGKQDSLKAAIAASAFAVYQRCKKLAWVRRLMQIGSISAAGAIEIYESHDGDVWRELVFYAGGL
jgi:hypothetical protein